MDKNNVLPFKTPDGPLQGDMMRDRIHQVMTEILKKSPTPADDATQVAVDMLNISDEVTRKAMATLAQTITDTLKRIGQ